MGRGSKEIEGFIISLVKLVDNLKRVFVKLQWKQTTERIGKMKRIKESREGEKRDGGRVKKLVICAVNFSRTQISTL